LECAGEDSGTEGKGTEAGGEAKRCRVRKERVREVDGEMKGGVIHKGEK
jgi:hypothetical protein